MSRRSSSNSSDIIMIPDMSSVFEESPGLFFRCSGLIHLSLRVECLSNNSFI